MSVQAGVDNRRRLVLLVLVAVVAVLVVGVGVAFNRMVLAYQPLQPGSYGGSSDGGRFVDSFRGDSMRVHRYEDGGEFYYEFDIRNGGSRSVKITDLPNSGETYYSKRIAVEIDDIDDPANQRGGTPAAWQEFEPFTLHPGEHRHVRFTHRFRSGCQIYQERPRRNTFGSGTWWEHQKITYRVWGIKRTTLFQMHTAIGIEVLGEC